MFLAKVGEFRGAEIRRKEHLVARGSAFPGRRVSTHRHTCLRKASLAYASRGRILPEPGALSSARFHASEELPLSSLVVSSPELVVVQERERERERGNKKKIERKSSECEATLRTQLKRYARTRPASQATWFFDPPPFCFYSFFHTLFEA